MKILLAILALGAALGASAAEAPPTVQSVLDRFTAAVGGHPALEAIDVRHYRGTIIEDLSWKDPTHEETPFVAEADAAGRVRYAESEHWAELPDSNDTALGAKLHWLLHPHFAVCVEEFFPGLTISGREVRAGRNVVVLAPRDLDFAYYALYFDEETGLLNHVGYHNDLQDWRAENGVLFPHRWVFGRKGGHTTYVFAEIGSGRAPTP